MIKIKAYPKYRLAQLYFPEVEAVTARQKLNLLIAKCPALDAALRAVQKNRKAKCYSAYEVSLILAWLGQPPFKDSSEVRV